MLFNLFLKEKKKSDVYLHNKVSFSISHSSPSFSPGTF